MDKFLRMNCSNRHRLQSISATETQIGPDVCVTGSGFTPSGIAREEYFGIPGSTTPLAGLFANVKPDGSFKIIDTTKEGGLVQCSNDQIQSTVTITVTETDSMATQKRNGEWNDAWGLLVCKRACKHEFQWWLPLTKVTIDPASR